MEKTRGPVFEGKEDSNSIDQRFEAKSIKPFDLVAHDIFNALNTKFKGFFLQKNGNVISIFGPGLSIKLWQISDGTTEVRANVTHQDGIKAWDLVRQKNIEASEIMPNVIRRFIWQKPFEDYTTECKLKIIIFEGYAAYWGDDSIANFGEMKYLRMMVRNSLDDKYPCLTIGQIDNLAKCDGSFVKECVDRLAKKRRDELSKVPKKEWDNKVAAMLVDSVVTGFSAQALKRFWDENFRGLNSQMNSK